MTDTLPVPTNRYQEKFGTPSGRAAAKVVDHLSDYLQSFIRNAPFAVMATADGVGRCDASPKGGYPGFVKVLDDRHLLLPDVRGNNLFQGYENIDTNPRVGLIFFIPGVEYTARVNGTAQVVDEEALKTRGISLEVFDPDDNAALQQGLLIEVEEAYAHCPRALKFSHLWDPEVIATNRETPPVKR
jgi:PPOX class probable FMN-dependent enzyme